MEPPVVIVDECLMKCFHSPKDCVKEDGFIYFDACLSELEETLVLNETGIQIKGASY